MIQVDNYTNIPKKEKIISFHVTKYQLINQMEHYVRIQSEVELRNSKNIQLSKLNDYMITPKT